MAASRYGLSLSVARQTLISANVLTSSISRWASFIDLNAKSCHKLLLAQWSPHGRLSVTFDPADSSTIRLTAGNPESEL